MRFSIHLKLILVTLFLLVGTAVPLAINAIQVFEFSARRNAEEQNLSQAIGKSKELDNFILSYLEKGKTIATFIASNTRENQSQNSLATNSMMSMDQDLLAVEVYKVVNRAPVFFRREAREDRFKPLGVDSTYLDQLKKVEVFPFSAISQGQTIVRNTTVDKKIPLIMMATPLTKNNLDLIDSFVVIYVHFKRFQSLMGQNMGSMKGGKLMFLVDVEGRTLLHSNEIYSLERRDLRTHPTIIKALHDPSPKKQVRYFDPVIKQQILSAFVRSSLGLILVTEISEKLILAPVAQVRRQALYISGILLSIMIFAVFLFSMTLTDPIEKLAEITLKIGKGDFSKKAKTIVRTKDEVGYLAETIDTMVEGLQERDKVKMLFSKFHGLTIAEEMLQGDVLLHGSNKDVVVFFSDVRGFTAFSEGHSPEEVVAMLNEYFQIMVHIINENHGVVDKFIGDAIMAVWGAPKTTGKDAYWCVKACLEMRLALDSLNSLRASRNQSPIMIGMGVHLGPAISGTIGSEERMEYTVIGDTVNQASRIEASTKAFGVDLLLSAEVAEAVKKQFVISSVGTAEVKGKQDALQFFKVSGLIDPQTGNVQNIKTAFSEYNPEHSEKIKRVG